MMMMMKRAKNGEGGRTIARFREWCEKRQLSLDEDNLRAWDEKHNGSRIRRTFGNDAEIFERALRILYRQFLDKFTVVTVRLPNVRQPVVLHSVRGDGRGMRRFVSDMDKAGVDFNRRRCLDNIRNEALRAKFLGLPLSQIVSAVEEAFAETQSAAAD